MSILSFDPSNLAQQYTQIERASKDRLLNTRFSHYNGQLTAIRNLQTALKSYFSNLSDWRQKGIVTNTAVSSNASALSVTSTSAAAPGTYDIFVQQRAQQHQIALPMNTALIMPADGELSIDLSGQTFVVDFSSMAAGSTLSDLAAAINSHADNPGIRATLLRAGTETYLVVASEETGASQQITLDFAAGADPAAAEISAALAARQQLSVGQDAIVFLGTDSTLTINSASNKIQNLIDGVTIDLLQTQTVGDAPVRISIQRDNAAASEKLKGFVQQFNDIMQAISKDPALKNDSMARSIKGQMRAAFQQPVDGTSFFSAGLEFDRNGKLSLSNAKFEQMMASDPSKIDELMSGAEGLIGRLEAIIEPYTKTFGPINDRQKALQGSLDLINTRKQRHEYSMELLYKRYVMQFTQMQRTVAQLESSMTQFNMK
jgi:flagellar hook-associated protein 2